MRFIRTAVLAATFVVSLPAFALTPSDYFGTEVRAATGSRTITIDRHTRYVNVDHRETVTFVLAGKSVSWHFDGISSRFPLSKIVELDASQRDIEIYVAPTVDR